MPDSQGRTRENEFAEIILQILKEKRSGEASFSELIEEIPNRITLTEEDLKPSDTRSGEQIWEQRVRNITSHKYSQKNYIFRGYLESIQEGLRITDLGRHKPDGELI